MQIELLDECGTSFEVLQALPVDMHKWDIQGAVPQACQGEKFQLLFQEFQGKGFSAWYNRFWVQHQTVLHARANLPILELRIGLTNQLRGNWENFPQSALRPGEFNLSFTPHIDTRATMEASQYYATFDIHVEYSLIEEMGIESEQLDQFWEKVAKGLPAELSTYPKVCPAAMLDGVQFILRNPYSAQAQHRLQEWNCRQILLIALETAAAPARLLPFRLTAAETEGLHAVKQFITDSFPKWPEQRSLCRKGGLNEFKLKLGFKHLFKMTAYDYHMQLKFQEAKKLLLQNTEPITAIAYQIGYDHHASFTQEFKKQFGYTPTWFRKHGRL